MAKIDQAVRLKPDALLRLVLSAKDALSLRERLRLSNAETRRLEALAAHQGLTPSLRERERRVVLYHLGPEAWRDAIRIAWAKSKDPVASKTWKDLLDFADRWPIPRFPLTGKDLLAHGLEPGPVLGRALSRLEDWWIASDFASDRESLLRR